MIPDPFIRERDGADALEEGFFILTMTRSARVDVPIAIWFGCPPDMDDDSSEDLSPRFKPTLDRSPRWMVEINGVLFGDPDEPACIAGQPVDNLDDFWPKCKERPTDEGDYRYRVDRALHAERYDELDPFGGTGRKIDFLTAPLPEFT